MMELKAIKDTKTLLEKSKLPFDNKYIQAMVDAARTEDGREYVHVNFVTRNKGERHAGLKTCWRSLVNATPVPLMDDLHWHWGYLRHEPKFNGAPVDIECRVSLHHWVLHYATDGRLNLINYIEIKNHAGSWLPRHCQFQYWPVADITGPFRCVSCDMERQPIFFFDML